MDIYGSSDIGRERKDNQDYFTFKTLNNSMFVIVCDGMGGCNGGNIASKLAVKVIKKYITDNENEDDIALLLSQAVDLANREIHSTSLKDGHLYGMGTTADVCFIKNKELHVAHVGDGRIYRITDDKIMQITTDHSMVEEMVKIGEITPLQAKTHPRKNIITRAVGTEDHVQVDYIHLPIHADDKILICTDGLTSYLDACSIKDIISESQSAKEAVTKCIQTANSLGGKDNITVVLVNT